MLSEHLALHISGQPAAEIAANVMTELKNCFLGPHWFSIFSPKHCTGHCAFDIHGNMLAMHDVLHDAFAACSLKLTQIDYSWSESGGKPSLMILLTQA